MKMQQKATLKFAAILIGLGVFVVLLALPLGDVFSSAAHRTLACAALMVVWWLTEAVPIAVTAMLPIVLFPLLGITDVKEVTQSYGDSIIFLFMGGFVIALALEKCNLHTRIALNIIKRTGVNANRVVLGFMIATAFLSMWISNTATAVIMFPIAMSVLQLLIGKKVEKITNKGHLNFAISIMLAIAYSANIGGITTIIGTPPNTVLIGLLENNYELQIGFSNWLIMAMPLAIILLWATYWMLTRVFFPNRMGDLPIAGNVIDEKLQELGKMTMQEKLVSVIFSLTAILWIVRAPINDLIGDNLLSDTGIAMTGAILMFATPANLKQNEFLMDWPTMKRLPWGILILFGGGLALAAAMNKTGIIELIGDAVATYQGYPHWFIILIVVGIMLFLTEFMSNVALVTVFLPMLFGIVQGLGMDLLPIAIPVTLASSCAFMLPMSTPPNAIVFGSGYLRIKDMVKAGWLLNIISILVLAFLGTKLVEWVF